jgi:hypothetical protein
MVLTPHWLEADVRGGKLVITTWANSDSGRERTVVYPVPHPQAAGLRESDCEQLIQANIHGHAHQVPGAIIVVANRAGHERAQLVIESISALRKAAPQAIEIPVPFSDAELKIRAELERETDVDFVEQPLKDVVIYFSEYHKIPLILAADKLAEASVSFTIPVTKTPRGISLRSALNLILKDLELAYTVRDQALVITTPEDAERLRTIAYQVRDLAEVQTGFPGIGSLGELIRATIAPDRWSHAMGAGPWYAGDDWLVIDQTDEVHEQVAALLATLRHMLAVEAHGPSQPIGPMRDMDRRIREALERPVKLDFDQMPLKDTVLYLSESLQVPILFSLKKLDEAAVSPDLPVTFHTSPIPARVALARFLKTAELDYVIRDEVLQITTTEDVESHLIARIYDTRTILEQMPGQQLRDFVRDNVQPDSWNYRGGGADIIRGLLVVSHTDRRHEEVERLVEKLTAEAAEAK